MYRRNVFVLLSSDKGLVWKKSRILSLTETLRENPHTKGLSILYPQVCERAHTHFVDVIYHLFPSEGQAGLHLCTLTMLLEFKLEKVLAHVVYFLELGNEKLQLIHRSSTPVWSGFEEGVTRGASRLPSKSTD